LTSLWGLPLVRTLEVVLLSRYCAPSKTALHFDDGMLYGVPLGSLLQHFYI
jgi:hypothetical protein